MFTNWKTSLAAVAIVGTVALFYFKVIDQTMMTVGIATLAGAGLLVSKDASNKQ